MDIDKMFKLPALPGGAGSKRKMPDQPTAEALKRFKAEEPAAVEQQSNKAAKVEDEDEIDPGPIADAGPNDEGEDDDEGRFFGGGLNDEENQILDIFDRAGDDDDEPATMTVPALRRFLGKFERAVAKNAEQRGKYPDDPTKFIESEADLDAAIKQFLTLTENPAAFYPELVKNGSVALLANLLSHENTDIAVDVIEVLRELTDDDVGAEDEDAMSDVDEEADEKASAARLAVAQLVDELLAQSVFELLVSNLKRLNEEEDSDRQGVFHILGVFENLLTFMPPLVEEVGATTDILAWLLKRISRKEHDSNKQYASEILSIMLQSSSANATKVADAGAIEILLMALAQYRGKDPRDGEEQEFVENAFNCLCSLLASPDSKIQFFEAEGVELMLLLMKEKHLARTRAIKVLDYAMQTTHGTPACERFVEMLGLKTLFSAFMGKGGGKKQRRQEESTYEDDEHILGIISSLLTNLSSDSPPRIRLVAKFVEANYEKVDRLLELRDDAERRLAGVNRRIATEEKALKANGEEIDELQEAEWYLERLDSGLSAIQAADYIIAWICMEDDGIRAHVETLLRRKSQSLRTVVEVLNEMASHLEVAEGENESDAGQQKIILEALMSYLGGVA